jgi:transposase
MAQIDSIRQLFFEKGLGYAEIARITGFDVKTVKKYVHMEDFNQPLPKPRQIRGSKLDKYKEQIDEWMVADKQERKKQRHTAKRIFDRLAAEHPGFDCSYRLVAEEEGDLRRTGRVLHAANSYTRRGAGGLWRS